MPSPLLQVISANHRRGAEISALDLRDGLRQRGWAMELVALRDAGTDDPLPVETLGRRRFSGLARLRRRMADVAGVLAHGSDALPATVAAGAGTGVPFVYRSIGDPRYWARRRDRRVRVRLELGRATGVVATFAGAAEVLVTTYGLPADRVHVIPNGRPLDRFWVPTAAQRARARTDLVGGCAGPVVAFVGSLSPEKAPERAVRAVAQLPEAHLVLAGRGPRSDALGAYGEAVAPGRVHLVGTLADVRDALWAADVLVLPSRTEGFPGVVIEAGLCGVPVVATDVGGVPDAVTDGVTGVLVNSSGDQPPGRLVEALAAGIEDALAERATMGPAARRVCASTFAQETITDRWERLLDEVFT